MGFDLKDSGFHIVLSKDVPQLIREKVKSIAEGFLERQGLRQSDISAFILHPGGQKLLSFMEAELGLTREDTHFSWDVLRRYGNLSSASVLFILQEWMTHREMPSGSYGLLMAFGPGISPRRCSCCNGRDLRVSRTAGAGRASDGWGSWQSPVATSSKLEKQGVRKDPRTAFSMDGHRTRQRVDGFRR